ncbi:hypothetical protein B9Q04_11885 [Candidatus Marsarchaeota G2 archaeon BE_D]|uniref:Proliferating cell nuclear antigen PCNA N-terminal domain-containing protein n=1 Tax=Candidatus Marsarchaeota G2 archaeon BE_D TaxID=1978158 RepID=A0A2R6C8S6_9ARCH|nr:MAG: hypothetical protein B9Q04_11885 [Candidatus Marsarchaeota G2 archaeon BE_D]
MDSSSSPDNPKIGDVREGFSLRFVSTMQLYYALRRLASINTTVTLSLSDSGLDARCISPSHVSMAILSIPKEAFTEYSIAGETRFALELEDLLTALQSAGESWVHLSIDGEAPGGSLVAAFKEGNVKVAFDDSISPPPDLRVEFDVESLLLLDELRSLVTHAYRRGCTHLNFTTHEELLSGNCGGLIKRFAPIWLKNRVGKAEASYALAELKEMVITSKTQRVVLLSYGNDKPLSLDYIIPLNYTLSAARLTYFLAPERPHE